MHIYFELSGDQKFNGKLTFFASKIRAVVIHDITYPDKDFTKKAEIIIGGIAEGGVDQTLTIYPQRLNKFMGFSHQKLELTLLEALSAFLQRENPKSKIKIF